MACCSLLTHKAFSQPERLPRVRVKRGRKETNRCIFLKQRSQEQFSSGVFHLCLNFREANVALGFSKSVWQLFKNTFEPESSFSPKERTTLGAEPVHKHVASWACRSKKEKERDRQTCICASVCARSSAGGRCEAEHSRSFSITSNLIWKPCPISSVWKSCCEACGSACCMCRPSTQRSIVYWLHRAGGGGKRAQEQNSEERRQKVTVHALTLRLIIDRVYEYSKPKKINKNK